MEPVPPLLDYGPPRDDPSQRAANVREFSELLRAGLKFLLGVGGGVLLPAAVFALAAWLRASYGLYAVGATLVLNLVLGCILGTSSQLKPVGAGLVVSIPFSAVVLAALFIWAITP